MAGTFLERVGEAFRSRKPEPPDRKAKAFVRVRLSRKMVTALVEVGLREAFSPYTQIARVDIEELATTQPRVARLEAAMTATIDGQMLTFRVEGEVEAQPGLSDGLTLRFRGVRARGVSGELESRYAESVERFAHGLAHGAPFHIPSVRLAGGLIESLTIRGDDVVEIKATICDAAVTTTLGL
jgi:hypothetical protein